MYYMIHATDHPEGPIQMARAYRNTVRPDEPDEDRQIVLDFLEPRDAEAALAERNSLSA